MDFGRAFRVERERLGISQREMAKRLNLSPSALWKIEANKTTPKWTTVCRFVSEMNIPVAYFFHQAFEPIDYVCP